jgi:hypothetical protein
MADGAWRASWLLAAAVVLAASAACTVEDGGGGGNDTGGGGADNGALDSADDFASADTDDAGGGDGNDADQGDLASPDMVGQDTALGDATGSQSCVVFETSQLLCDDVPDGAASTIIFACQAGDTCERPEARNVDRDDIECVDTYRYRREEYPATCDDVREWFAGDLACLIPVHCSGNPDRAGDWRCVDFECVCPEGGFCPTPLPPGREDMGSDDTSGPGEDTGGPDAGEPDLTFPTEPDAEDEPDTGGPTPPGG